MIFQRIELELLHSFCPPSSYGIKTAIWFGHHGKERILIVAVDAQADVERLRRILSVLISRRPFDYGSFQGVLMFREFAP